MEIAIGYTFTEYAISKIQDLGLGISMNSAALQGYDSYKTFLSLNEGFELRYIHDEYLYSQIHHTQHLRPHIEKTNIDSTSPDPSASTLLFAQYFLSHSPGPDEIKLFFQLRKEEGLWALIFTCNTPEVLLNKVTPDHVFNFTDSSGHAHSIANIQLGPHCFDILIAKPESLTLFKKP